MNDRKPTVMFACVHNAGRSQIAEGWLRHLAGAQVEVLSGGSEPADAVNPAAVAAMQEVGIDIASAQPRAWTTDDLRAADVVVTMGCGDVCPVYPGRRYLDWEIEDPTGKSLQAIRSIRDEIEARVRLLLAELDLLTAASPE
jgi:arsenate reductase